MYLGNLICVEDIEHSSDWLKNRIWNTHQMYYKCMFYPLNILFVLVHTHTLCFMFQCYEYGSYLHVVHKIETENMYDWQSSCGQINYELSFLQGFSATSQETGTAVLSGLPGANPHRSACPESGICNARVHTVWVGIQKNALIHALLINTSCLDFAYEADSEVSGLISFLQWSASFWCFIAHSWLG